MAFLIKNIAPFSTTAKISCPKVANRHLFGLNGEKIFDMIVSRQNLSVLIVESGKFVIDVWVVGEPNLNRRVML
jgi:hypothetical protein